MILEIIAIIIIFIVILLFIFLLIGLKINVNLCKEGSDLKGIIEVKWTFIKIFSKNFPENTENNRNMEGKNRVEKSNKFNKSIKSKKSKNNSKKSDKNLDIENEAEKEKNRFNEFKTLIPLLKENFDDIFDFFLICVNSINLKKFNTNISLGFSSPVDTVTVVGYIWAFSSVPNLSKHFYLSAEPVFTKETIDFDSELILKINLLRPVGKLLKLLTKKSMLELIWKSRKLFNND